jgi:L-fucose isomerase-like protein
VAEALRIAVVSIARPTFDVALAQEVANTVVARLEGAGMRVGGTGARLIMDAVGAQEAAAALADEPFDLLLLLQASFADSTMAVALAHIAHAQRLPILLWAVPEPRDGGRLRLNSLCGINLAGHAFSLNKLNFDFLLEEPESNAAISKIGAWARAGRARHRLQGAAIGLVGEHPGGFETCAYDEADLDALLGVRIERTPLSALLHAAASADDAARRPFMERAAELAPNLGEMDEAATRGTAGVHAALQALAAERALNGVAVRCWPEFFTELGCAACGAMSLLSEGGCPASCEADVNGTVTLVLLQALTTEPPFIADLVSIDADSNSGVLWHCGLAPASMADSEQGGIRATVHSNRKLPLLFEFALKPGRVTLARLHRTSLEKGVEGYSLAVGGGYMVQAPRSFGGTSGVIHFDSPARAVFGTMMRNGMEHHLCLTYGDCRAELRAFASLVGLPLLELT